MEQHITLTDYWMGREKLYADSLTDTIVDNANETVRRANALLSVFYRECSPVATRKCNSGWRPRAVNMGVPGSALRSKHITAQAIDLSDDDKALSKFCMSATGKLWLSTIGLWMEHPNATPRWCHVQTVAPGSGNRVFFP